ncbi:SRPBCC family protein [Streptomyces sp. NRRL F-5123]|uniref:SRPBCC family protein n=1 Tax=Streptomyces sp. NRRL F-5123 TaxID=1463856 RepID=UPI0004E19A33|nr:SRPBCC family protein [Streptomyces sp. NRRL F-5123]
MPSYSYAVTIAAPAAQVWQVLAAPEKWPELTPSMTSVRGLAGPDLALGARFAVRQPRLRQAVWQVTALDEGTSFVWETHAPGAASRAAHVLDPDGPATRLTLTLDQSGPLSWPIAFLLGPTIRRYLTLEGDGMKNRTEQPPSR